MRKYLWIAVIALIASAVYFTSCERIPKMMDPLLPDAEQIEPTEMPPEIMEEMMEEMMEMPVDSVDVLVYIGSTWWIEQMDAATQAGTLKSLLESEGIQARITADENIVRDWMLATTGNSAVNVLILYGVLPNTIYAAGNTQPDGSIAENWLETSDGDTILNHADYIGYQSTPDPENRRGHLAGESNRHGGLQNLMDIPNIVIPFSNGVTMIPTEDGMALTPSLGDFTSTRFMPLNQLQGEWFAEKVFASDTGDDQAAYADPVIVRDGDRGRIAIVHATSEVSVLPNAEVAAEIIINYLLAPPMMSDTEMTTPAEPPVEPMVDVEMEMPAVVGIPGIYWADDIEGAIYGSDLDGTNVREIVPNVNPWDIAVNPLTDKVYWTDRSLRGIYEANLDGTNVEEIVSGLSVPGDILIDLAGNKLYWTDQGTSKIQRVNLDGTNLQDVLTTGRGLDGIALDAANEKIYWTEWSARAIRRANLDGTNAETLISTGVIGPAYVGLDVPSGKMYLLDHEAGKVLLANLDGTNLEELITGLDGPSDMVLDLVDRKMYWTLHHNRGAEVWWADLDGTNAENIVNMPELGNSIGIALSHLLR